MIGRIIGGGIAAGIVSFVLGFLYWGIADQSGAAFKPLPGGDISAKVLDFGFEESGWYFHPLPTNLEGDHTPEEKEAHMQACMDKMAEGPIAIIGFRKEGGIPMGQLMGTGFVQLLVHALLLAFLAAMVRPKAGFMGRFGAVLLASLAAVVLHDGSHMIWWHMPASYPQTNAIYHGLNGVLVGLVLAAIVRPKANPS